MKKYLLSIFSLSLFFSLAFFPSSTNADWYGNLEDCQSQASFWNPLTISCLPVTDILANYADPQHQSPTFSCSSADLTLGKPEGVYNQGIWCGQLALGQPNGYTCEVVGGYCIQVAIPTSEVCGNGILEGDEECDDGDTSSGDGCSNLCVVETDYNCVGEPSVCTLIGGDGSNGFPAIKPSQVSSLTTKLGNALSQLVDFFVSGSGLFFTLSVGLIILMYLIRWARFGSIDTIGVSDLSDRIKSPNYQSKI